MTDKPTRRPPRRRTEVWKPTPELLQHMPKVSGNDLNGVGETTSRRPVPVMWDWKVPIAHADMQEEISRRHSEDPHIGQVLRRRETDAYRPAPLAAKRHEGLSAAEWTAQVREFALTKSPVPVEDVGVVQMRQEWVFDGHEVTEQFAVLLLVRMDHSELSKAPDWPAGQEVQRQYNRGTDAARALADWLRSRGWPARGHGGPSGGPFTMTPAAIEAGLGELGKHGSLIHREFGSSFRLACVLTDVPLLTGSPDVFGADDFCHKCRICVDACPPDAILPEKTMVRGVEKWYVDFDRCLPFFAEANSCGVCIAVCPWSKPGRAQKMASVMLARRDGAPSTANAQDTTVADA